MHDPSMTCGGVAGERAAAAPRSATSIQGSHAPASARTGWLLYIGLMLLLGAYQGFNQIIGHAELAAWKPFSWEISSVLMWIVLFPLIMRWERRFRVDSRPRGPVVAAHLAGAIAVSLVHVTGMVGLRKLMYAAGGSVYDFAWMSNVPLQYFYEMQKDLFTYVLVLGALLAARELRIRRVGELRAAQLAADLTSARLAHLTAQIEPHFLFNALNAISNRMHEDVAAADSMISQLGDLLRSVYAGGDDPLVPLSHELAWLASYAAMMSERFRGQLSFQVRSDAALGAARVPRLLLQPLVENAIRHGLGEGRGCLTVEVRREGPELVCTVSDDGAGLPPGPLVHGTGLANVARRLQLLFPGEHSLRIAAREGRGTTVRVSFPVRP